MKWKITDVMHTEAQYAFCWETSADLNFNVSQLTQMQQEFSNSMVIKFTGF